MTKTMPRETTVTEDTPMPPNYHFIRKGNVYITKNARLQTHASDLPVYPVISSSTSTSTQHSHQRRGLPLGIRVPAHIYHAVMRQHALTKPTRAATVARRDHAVTSKFRAQLLASFPRVPDHDVETILKHTLKKRSGRVGRKAAGAETQMESGLGLEEVVRLAVWAHVRHMCTGYDALLRGGMEREKARERVRGDVRRVVAEWSGDVTAAAETKGKKEKEKVVKDTGKGKGGKWPQVKTKARTRTNMRPKKASVRAPRESVTTSRRRSVRIQGLPPSP